MASSELIESDDVRAILAPDNSGFSLDGAACVAAFDRAGLERRLRCCARLAFALGRLGPIDAQRLVYRLPTSKREGTTALMLTPLEPIRRLAAPIPPLRRHRYRYHGVLARNSPLYAGATAYKGPYSHLVTGGVTWLQEYENPWAATLMLRYEILTEQRDTDIEPGGVPVLEGSLGKEALPDLDNGATGCHMRQTSHEKGQRPARTRASTVPPRLDQRSTRDRHPCPDSSLRSGRTMGLAPEPPARSASQHDLDGYLAGRDALPDLRSPTRTPPLPAPGRSGGRCAPTGPRSPPSPARVTGPGPRWHPGAPFPPPPPRPCGS